MNTEGPDYSDYSDYSEYSDYSDYSEYSDYSIIQIIRLFRLFRLLRLLRVFRVFKLFDYSITQILCKMNVGKCCFCTLWHAKTAFLFLFCLFFVDNLVFFPYFRKLNRT